MISPYFTSEYTYPATPVDCLISDLQTMILPAEVRIDIEQRIREFKDEVGMPSATITLPRANADPPVR